MAKLKAGLSQRALLVSVNVSQWAARKMDKRATETVNVAHRTSSLAGAYSKKLLPQALELETINTITSQTRKYYYEQTLHGRATEHESSRRRTISHSSQR